MKNLKLLCLLLLFSSTILAHGLTPPHSEITYSLGEDEELIYENSAITFKVVKSDLSKFLSLTNYDEERQYFSIKTDKVIEYLQVYTKEGKLEYQLPINDKLIHLSLKQFDAGVYSINLLFEDETDYLSTKLIKK